MTILRLPAAAALLVASCWIALVNSTAAAPPVDVASDRRAFVEYYRQRFPDVAADDFVLGVYAIDRALAAQYAEINEFPPYEFALDEGAELVQKPFENGNSLLDCLRLDKRGVHQYPYFSATAARVVTLPLAINECRERNGESPLSYRKGTLTKILAHLNHAARGTRRDVAPPDTPAANAAYTAGKAYFHLKRGQLNLSCADCHVTAAGRHLREQTLAPLLGAVNHYPVYGLRWGTLGTLHQRFVGCLEQVRADAEYPQSRAYRELEYFLALMSNGLPMTGPGIHR